MTKRTKTAEIEAEIEHERTALADSLNKLSQEFSPDNLMKTVSETFDGKGAEFVEGIATKARENPLALGLMGAGLAWLMVSRDKEPDTVAYDDTNVPTAKGLRTDGDHGNFDQRLARAEGDVNDPSRMTRLKSSAAEMRASLYDNTEMLSDAARDRVIEARKKALVAQEKIERLYKSGKSKAGGAVQKNPALLYAGLAVAGAAAAFALPRTSAENRAFGQMRDDLVRQAELALTEEVERAKAFGAASLEEGKRMAREAAHDIPSGEDIVDTAEAKLRTAAKRAEAQANAKTH